MSPFTGRRARLSARLLAGAAVALTLAGCTASGASTSSVNATGTTLDIWISEPAAMTTTQQDVVDAARLAFDKYKGEVSDFALQLKVARDPKLSDNARAAIQDQSAIAYIGELAPGATDQTAGITNALDLLAVSPTDNALELAQSTSAIHTAPGKYYESLSLYGHTFARVVPSDAQEAAFGARLISSLGARSVYVTNDGSDYGKAISAAVKSAASASSLTVASSESGAGAIYFAGMSASEAAALFDRAVTAAPGVKLVCPSALDTPAFDSALTPQARRSTYITTPGYVPASLTAAGAAFRAAFDARYGHEPAVEAIFGYAAMTDVLDAIEQAGTSANDRAKVVHAFLKLKDPAHTVLPSYSFDASGDTTLRGFVWMHPGGAPHAGQPH